ncbi:hypothetical protein CDO22_17965 [Sinorhizobium meliloti]|uniref:hypothetical protein n=1 Tax=Rhizobium meliloti TaxID=382 RepID=UPI000B49FD71|nr:hypothetical protein [Sinorhizobium meliloti]ASQ10187.1 hypothetical protein CDO22_08435 [Sinorhizobium meliloti]ASQ11878.1 hypothetical protein CDO22_17965 [Sinorhizobium meliloti]MQU82945.1 hypothetical protein [Sinorhizobium meliloti]MQU83327.1 hypothetical protein [Sinorhizobium meliloti]MQU83649.1 hypothetical protein [Sinorhizobium meliloti]
MNKEDRKDLVEPYAHEYGRGNGDGTYSVIIERGRPRDPSPDWPVKPLYAHPPASSAEIASLRRELEEARKALEVASDEILSMYRTWVADDYEAMPPKNSLPGKAYYSARAALRAGEEGR